MSDIARTAVNQAPNGGTDYPFMYPSVLDGMFLDVYFSYQDTECAYVLPFVFKTTDADVGIYDANDVAIAIADSSEWVTQVWGDRTIVEWKDSTCVLRFVATDLGIDAIPPQAVTLDPRTYNRVPARVTSLRVGLVTVNANVVLEAGNNIELSGTGPADTLIEGRRFITTINIDAVPGAGRGKVDGCDETATKIRRINNVVPDCGGNFVIETDPCFRAQLPLALTGGNGASRTGTYEHAELTATEAASAFELVSDCYPCCSCDGFVRTYMGLKRMWNKWQEVATKAEATRDTYHENRERWLAARQCRIDNPARLVTTTNTKCKTMIGGSYCNLTSCCIAPVELRFTLQRYKDGELIEWTNGVVVEAVINGSPTRHSDRDYTPDISGAVVRFFLDYADPQAISIAKMRFCTAGCLSTETLKVTMTVHIPQPPPNEDTEDPCTLDEIVEEDVPEEIRDVWTLSGIPTTPAIRSLLTRTVALNPNPPIFECGC